ncbi:phage terminase large subunit [Bartonella sp. CDC_skunk]|nr:phage terminase large subunit [Bartonella sp. CDC_skunk]AQX26654.1 phage terminase large subunit [Bartonella sp. Raccoon60]
MAALKGYQFGMAGISGTLLCARQFQNSLAESSLEEIKRAIEAYDFLQDYYKVGEASIKSRDGRISFSVFWIRPEYSEYQINGSDFALLG